MFKMTKTSSSENGGGWPVSARMFAVAAALVSATLATPNVFAAAIPVGGGGVLQLSNLTGQLVGVNASCINWGQPAACQTTTGIQDSVSGSDPALFTVGSTALDTIKDLPFGVATPLVGFMTVQSPLPGGQVLFDLNSLVVPGAFGNCTVFAVNATCNPGGGSIFVLFQNTANQVSISFSTTQSAYTGSIATGFTPYNGVFTTQLSGNLSNGNPDTIPNILNFFAAGNTITSTWSATLSPTPEPGTWLLLGAGLIAAGSLRKVRSVKG